MTVHPTTSPRHVLISGAGPVGSLLALCLAQRGHTVDVYERRADMRLTGEDAGRSINLALSVRGWQALDRAGVGDRLRAHAIPMAGRMVHPLHGDTNLQPYSDEGHNIFAVHRAELNKALMSYAEEHERVAFHFDCKTRAVDISDDGVTLTLERTDGRTFSVSGDAVIGADGANSAVRQALMRQVPRFNYSVDWLEHGYKEVYIPAAEGEGDDRFRLEKNALHIWPRGKYMLIALPNLDGSFTGTLFLAYDDADGPSFNALDEDDEAIRRFFEDSFPDVVQHIGDPVENFRKHPTAPLGTIRCGPWNKGGRACVIGDAAHAIVPFYGQGLVSGFEDVDKFTQLLDAHDDDWAEAFDVFSTTRKPDADGIAELALGNFYEMRDHVADDRYLQRKKLEKRAAELFHGRFIPFYSMVTFTHMPYSQALAWGRAQNAFLETLLDDDECKTRFMDEDYKDVLTGRIGAFLAEREAAQ